MRFSCGDTAGDTFEPRIVMRIAPDSIVVEDNGYGMTPGDLRTHFWSAGSSSKNTPDARAAGVVGTFGVGAMANFGVADELEVESESLVTGERTKSIARRETLSVTEECIDVYPLASQGIPGTCVRADMAPSSLVNVAEAEAYIAEFVRFVDIPVEVNGKVVSQGDLRQSLVPIADSWEYAMPAIAIGPFVGNAVVRVSGNGDVTFEATSLGLPDEAASGTLILRQGVNLIRTYRSGFGIGRAQPEFPVSVWRSNLSF